MSLSNAFSFSTDFTSGIYLWYLRSLTNSEQHPGLQPACWHSRLAHSVGLVMWERQLTATIAGWWMARSRAAPSMTGTRNAIRKCWPGTWSGVSWAVMDGRQQLHVQHVGTHSLRKHCLIWIEMSSVRGREASSDQSHKPNTNLSLIFPTTLTLSGSIIVVQHHSSIWWRPMIQGCGPRTMSYETSERGKGRRGFKLRSNRHIWAKLQTKVSV